MEDPTNKVSFWAKQIEALNSLVAAIKLDRAESKNQNEGQRVSDHSSSNLKIWFSKYWTSGLLWGLLLIFIWKMVDEPPKRNHHKKGSKYNPYVV